MKAHMKHLYQYSLPAPTTDINNQQDRYGLAVWKVSSSTPTTLVQIDDILPAT